MNIFQELYQTLKSIDAGEISIILLTEVDYCGNIEYQTSNGWKIIVFNDCDEWDYIDTAISPSGEVVDFDGICDNISSFDELREFQPNQKSVKENYKIAPNSPYKAEDWVEVDWFGGRKFFCKICAEEHNFISNETALIMSDEIEPFAIKHYNCNPIYGKQIQSKLEE